MKRSRILSASALSAIVAFPLLVMAPAYATTIDVSGASFSFSNDVDENFGESAQIGDSVTYPNVATVGGVSIDAVVTLIDASDNSVGNDPYVSLSETEIDDLNLLNESAVDVAGCYSNADYVDAYNLSEAYAELDFVAGDLYGNRIEFIDEYDDETNDAINNQVFLCVEDFESDIMNDGFIQIRVDFEVDGEPVTLNNLILHATDIDGLQSFTLFDPKPTEVFVSEQTELDVVETADEVSFNAPDIGSSDGDPTALNFVGEAEYDGVSSISYEFALTNSVGGSLTVLFESYFNADGELASTGTDAATPAIAGLAILGVGAALLIVRRVRRNRS